MNVPRITTTILDLLAPQRCVLCSRPLIAVRVGPFPLCSDCAGDLEPLTGARCETCGVPLISEIGRCTGCRSSPRVCTRHLSVFAYDQQIAELLRCYKGKGMRSLAAFFAACLHDVWARHFPQSIVVPVPGHPQGRRRRGWDQSTEIGSILARDWHTPVCVCLRRASSRRQKELTFEQRQSNLKGRITPLGSAGSLRGRSVTLLDDVYTTGATVECCAEVLRTAGAATVSAMTIAMDL